MKKWHVTVFALTMAIPSMVWADDGAVATLEEVVVTATKTKEAVREVPNAVVVKDALDIEDTPARGLGELLGGEPGLDWRTYGNYGGAAQEIDIRGLGGDATQVFLDGININSPSLGTADLSQLPLNSIERVEVVKGPGSLLYGTGAMAGTVNILTKSPRRDRPDFKVTSGFGTQGTLDLAAEQGMYVTDGLGYYLTASHQEGDGFRDNSGLNHNDASLKLVCDKDKRLQATLFGAWIDRSYGLPGVQPPAGTKDSFVNGTRMYDADAASLVNEGEERNRYTVLDLKSLPLSWLTLSLRGDAVHMESYNYNRNNGPMWPLVAGEGEETWVTNEVLGLEGTAEMRLPGKVTLLTGSQYRDYGYTNEVGGLDASGAGMAGTQTEAQHGVFTHGTYGEAQWQANRYLKLLSGFRYEEHSMFGHETLPRFGVVLTPLEDTTIKLGRGKDFKAPTMNDLYWPDDGWTRGNPDLKPETGWHNDITVEQSFLDKKLIAQASYFKVNIDDKINWAENPAFPTVVAGVNYWTPSNVSTYESRGWELGIVIKPVDPVRVELSYTRTQAQEEETTGPWRQAPGTPTNQARGEVDYFMPSGLTTTAVLHYVGDRPASYASATATEPSNTLNSYMTTDLRLSQHFKEHWLAALNCNNIFNAGYETYVGSFQDATGGATQQGYPGAGRSILASISYEF